MLAAQASHAFMGMTKMGQAAVFETRGNRDCHVILRGGKQPNYDAASVQAACDALTAAKLRPQVMIDLVTRQQQQAAPAPNRCRSRSCITNRCGRSAHHGVMVESHLQEGRQDIVAGSRWRGVSVTDACISFEQTRPLLAELAGGAPAGAR